MCINMKGIAVLKQSPRKNQLVYRQTKGLSVDSLTHRALREGQIDIEVTSTSIPFS